MTHLHSCLQQSKCLEPPSFPCLFTITGNPADVDFPPPNDVLSHDYDPVQMAEYFRRRPVAVLTRASTLLKEVTAFGLPVLVDLWTGKLQVGGKLEI